MTPEQISRLLDDLGNRLGPAGQHVFELAIKQVYVNAITATVFLVISLLPLLAIPRIYKWQQQGDSYSGRDLAVMSFGLFEALLIICATINAFIYIPAVLNPEYAAIRDILVAIGGGK